MSVVIDLTTIEAIVDVTSTSKVVNASPNEITIDVTPNSVDVDVQPGSITLVEIGSNPQGLLPSGGTAGQIPSKNTGDDYDIGWIDPPTSLPVGGTTGQALIKQSATDGDADWSSVGLLPPGGNTAQVLVKNSPADYDIVFEDLQTQLFNIYKAVGNTSSVNISNIEQPIVWDSFDISTSNDVTLTGSEIEINEDGVYKFTVTLRTDNSNRTELFIRTYLNTGSGLQLQPYEVVSDYVSRDSRQNTGSVTLISVLELTDGDVIQFRGEGDSSGDCTMLDEGTSLIIEKVDISLLGSSGGGGDVTSVNGQTGIVVLNADDIDDSSTSNKFTSASDISKLAGIEAGATADLTGPEIKALYEVQPNAFTDTDRTKLDGIEVGAQVNTVNPSDIVDFETSSDLNIRDTNNRNRSNHTGTQSVSTLSDFDTNLSGILNTTPFTPTSDYHPATKKYVDDIAIGAGSYTDEKAQDAVGNIFVDGAHISFSYDDIAPSITATIISASITENELNASINASLDLADSSLQSSDIGVVIQGHSSVLDATTASFTVAQENKLSGIETGATADQTASEVPVTDAGGFYTSTDVEGVLQEIGPQLGAGGAVDSVNGQTGVVVLNADDIDDSATTNKFTTAANISKLAGIETGAQVNTVTSVNSQTGVITLDKTDIGLGNVDNTSDVDKPVSTATQLALNGKADSSHTHVKADITDFNDGDYATAAQGSLADSSLQSSDIGSTVQAYSAVLQNTTASFTTAQESKLSGIQAGADVTNTANVNAAGATMNTDTNVSGNSWVLDEDDFNSDSDTKVPTQQSTKAYIDDAIASINLTITVGTTQPVSPNVGDIWIDTN